MQVSVVTGEYESISFQAPTLDVARLVASAHGFHVDVEPMEPGRVKLTASSLVKDGVTIHCSGSTLNEAAASLIKRLT